MRSEDIQRLTAAILDYRQWAASLPKRRDRDPALRYGQVLLDFLRFAIHEGLGWEQIFTYRSLEAFRSHTRAKAAQQALMALGIFLYSQGKIDQPIEFTKPPPSLPEIYEQYLVYLKEIRALSVSHLRTVRVVLAGLHAYLQKHDLDLSQVKIDQIDGFLATFQVAENTRDIYRYALRGFLRYLHEERGILQRDLAAVLVHPPRFAPVRLPRFLRPEQIQKLFDHLSLDTPSGIRSAAMVHLAFYLGLRPVEISRIRLDDLCFETGELAVPERKTQNPITLPLPQRTLKTIGAYIHRVRPRTELRELFLRLTFPYRPADANLIMFCIRRAMRKAGLPGSPYWLRHTYAQCLLNERASIYEIKEMLGHRSLQSSQRYLHIQVGLMRTVLFDETL
jgi:integrase/recombinase XerD